MRTLGTIVLMLLLVVSFSFADVIVIKDDISTNTTWSSDNEYHLDGLIFVDQGAILTIQAGTVIKGLDATSITTGDGASALVVRRGAKIMADGTADHPIIFTSEYDDVNDPSDLTPTDRGLWGGLIILGKATTNQPTTDNQIEGIPTTENALFGGNDDFDNSGVLRYVSIRHGGFSISGVPGDEINGLTMGAVGRGTTIEFVEVYANFDDGFEWFGGTVNTKNLVAAFCGDDAFDYDQGFRGKGQFWFTIQGTDEAGRGGEHDGGDDDETGMPYAMPIIWNATYIGSGADLTPAPGGDGNNHALIFRDNAGGQYASSIFTDYTGDGVTIEDIDIEDSRSKLENGMLTLKNNLWWNFGAGETLDAIVPQDFVRNSAGFADNQIVNPLLRGISRTTDGGLDPRPIMGSPAADNNVLPPSDGFFTQTMYYGAFEPGKSPWILNWTALHQEGVIATPETGNVVVVSDDISENAVWTAENEYHLDGLIFVNDGATLAIEAGTVVKGLDSPNITTGDGASALIIRRGGKIMAQGTADAPIIFTSEYDDVNDPADLTSTDRGLWGGVIVLGKATTNQPTTDNQIEGIPTTENALFGGNDDADNSGVLRYVSIR
ncbi:T9SS C-terminal target domain-containing protein, partial [candidate division KSB1 bacterium]|nr:T9SS C-terminal target domain-containing protein [candidate division KSB1 bacterium]